MAFVIGEAAPRLRRCRDLLFSIVGLLHAEDEFPFQILALFHQLCGIFSGSGGSIGEAGEVARLSCDWRGGWVSL